MTDMTATNSVTVSSKALKAAFKALGSQMDTVRIAPEEDGWHLYAMSPSKFSMVNILLKASAFDPYDQWPAFAVKVDDILEPLAKAAEKATLDISKGYLSITTGRMNFHRPIMPDFEQYPRIPNTRLSIEVSAPAEVFDEIVLALSDKEVKPRGLAFEQDAECLRMVSCEEDDPVHAVTLTLPKRDCGLMAGEGRAEYSHRIMAEIFSTIPKGVDVDIQYDSDCIMNISYTVDDAYIVFVIAPWVERNE